MWNKNMILIDNPYSSTRYNPNGKFCPIGIIDRSHCLLPCFFYDSQYCTYWMYSYNQEKAAKEWHEKFIQGRKGEPMTDTEMERRKAICEAAHVDEIDACSLCNDIKKIEQYKEKYFWNRGNAIVRKENEAFGLWIECADSYSSGVAMEINYCPVCGRKLK